MKTQIAHPLCVGAPKCVGEPWLETPSPLVPVVCKKRLTVALSR